MYDTRLCMPTRYRKKELGKQKQAKMLVEQHRQCNCYRISSATSLLLLGTVHIDVRKRATKAAITRDFRYPRPFVPLAPCAMLHKLLCSANDEEDSREGNQKE